RGDFQIALSAGSPPTMRCWPSGEKFHATICRPVCRLAIFTPVDASQKLILPPRVRVAMAKPRGSKRTREKVHSSLGYSRTNFPLGDSQMARSPLYNVAARIRPSGEKSIEAMLLSLLRRII